MTFSSGEALLDDWMDQNARVCWLLDPEPWLLESRLFTEADLPLNLDQNAHNRFHAQLAAARAKQHEQARQLPPLPR